MNIASELSREVFAHADFAADLLAGLSAQPKSLPCKWFYDEAGSHLFEAITQTPEYYLTRSELGLLQGLAPELAHLLPDLTCIIEPGSGSSAKARMLLATQPRLERYVAIDISEEFLLQTARQLSLDFPALDIMPLVADFSEDMPTPALPQQASRLVFFPGSTIGNFSPAGAKLLLRDMHRLAGHDNWLLIGVDMTQDEARLLAAYDDATGITARFNLNLLARAKRELGADFDLGSFTHEARFNRAAGRVEMHLRSQARQRVEAMGHGFHFARNETIHTENCYKYTLQCFTELAMQTGWQLRRLWQDRQVSDFGVFLLQAI